MSRGWASMLAVLMLTLVGCSGEMSPSSSETKERSGAQAQHESGGQDQASGSEPDGGANGSGDGAADEGGSDEKGDGHRERPTYEDRDSPGKPDKQGRQEKVFARIPGSSDDRCVVVGNRRDVRSGGFVAGPFDTARKTFGKGEPGRPAGTIRVYWVPLHSEPMPGLTVTAELLGTNVRHTFTQDAVADADQWRFYDTALKLQRPGRWRLTGESGEDRGCFEVRIAR